MKKLIKKILGLVKEDANQAIKNAVDTDDVKKAHKILASGAVDVNMRIYYEATSYIDSHDYTTVTCKTCLLRKAKSAPMRRLLQHFGALPLEELEKRWDAEDEKRKKEKQEQEKRRQEEEKRQLALKAETDNRFLDEVLH